MSGRRGKCGEAARKAAVPEARIVQKSSAVQLSVAAAAAEAAEQSALVGNDSESPTSPIEDGSSLSTELKSAKEVLQEEMETMRKLIAKYQSIDKKAKEAPVGTVVELDSAGTNDDSTQVF